jgi:hypothetical protein
MHIVQYITRADERKQGNKGGAGCMEQARPKKQKTSHTLKMARRTKIAQMNRTPRRLLKGLHADAVPWADPCKQNAWCSRF